MCYIVLQVVRLLKKHLYYPIIFTNILVAENFIKEFSRIEPQVLRKYNFEKFLIRENSEGYRQEILHILEIYTDKRKAFKPSSSKNINSSFVLVRIYLLSYEYLSSHQKGKAKLLFLKI